MRPRVIEFLESSPGLPLVEYLVPTGTTILVMAVAVVLWVMTIRGRRIGMPGCDIVGASLAGVACGIVGSRIFNLLQHLDRTLENPRIILDPGGGTTSWGAYGAGILGFCAYLVIKRKPVLAHTDLLASSLGLGPFIDRVGCFMNGCCFGGRADVAWAVRFPRFSFAHSAHLDSGLIDAEAPLSLPVHPVQLYASLMGLVLFLVASRFWKAFRPCPGATFAFYWLAYGLARFFIEFFRGDSSLYGALQLTMAQYFCIAIVTVSAMGLTWRLRVARELNGDRNGSPRAKRGASRSE